MIKFVLNCFVLLWLQNVAHASIVAQVNAGVYISGSYFLDSDGTLWSIGYLNTINYGNTYSQILFSSVAAVATNPRNDHPLLVKSDGSLWAFGADWFGELGDGTNAPEQIVSSNVTAIAVGQYHSLVLKSDGSLWAMGDNRYGQLGDGSTTSRSKPEQIVSSNVTAISAGVFHSLFLKSDGSLWAMGWNRDGELGDGTSADSHLPEQILPSNVTMIAAEDDDSLFVKSDGSLWGMGDNYWGQLGNGGGSIPFEIVSSNVTAIAGGANSSLFLKLDGSVWAMGLESCKGNRFTLTPQQVVPLRLLNRNFDTGDFLGWTNSGNFSSCAVDTNSWYAHSGIYGAELGPKGSLGFLSQALPTTPGATYLLSFWLDSPDGENPNEFLATWNGNTLLDETNLAAIGWTNI